MSFSLKEYVKRIVAGNLFFYIGKNERFIFLFHDISEKSEMHHSDEYSTIPSRFFELVEHLHQKFEITDIDSVLSESYTGKSGKPLAAICFDDGFYSVYKLAYPYFKQKQIPFTLFINQRAVTENQLWFTNLVINKDNSRYWEAFYNEAIDKNKITLEELKHTEIWKIFRLIKNKEYDKLYNDWRSNKAKQGKIFCDITDLKEMYKSGLVSIHSHSVNHYVLSECDRDLSFRGIKDNKLFVESITGKKDEHFALPFGKDAQYDLRVMEQCRDMDYKYVYTTYPNSFSIKEIKGTNPGLIPRISLTNQTVREMMFMVNMGIVKKRKEEVDVIGNY